MLSNERQQQICEFINVRGTVKVNDLSDLFHVSTETIRQDLNKLEIDKKIQRVHGGACSMQSSQIEPPYYEREVLNVPEKTAIANEAINMIEPNEQIILDASTTCWYLAKQLPNIPLTVLTNSFRVTSELVNKDKIDVVMIAGILFRRSLCFVGRTSQTLLGMYHVNKAFISAKGLHYENGISDAYEAIVLVKQEMINIAKKTILLADNTKFGKSDFMQIAGLERIDTIITDMNTSDEQIGQLKEHAHKVIKAL